MANRCKVSVIGAGIMGHGIATQFAVTGHPITLYDHRQSNLDHAEEQIRKAVRFLVNEGITQADPSHIIDEIEFSREIEQAVSGTDLVIETVSEDLELKQTIFETVAFAAPETAILASNTSGLQITRIADAIPGHAHRVVGCHWWNPPYLMPLVEIVHGEKTSDRIADRAAMIVEAADRNPIHVNRDVPGFVWNRIQFAVIRECMHIVDEGIASLEAVDAAVRDGYALRTAAVGPFETVDLSGLSLFKRIASEIYPSLSDDDEPSHLFQDHLSAGRDGISSGAGFYDYDRSSEEVTRTRDERIAAILRGLRRM